MSSDDANSSSSDDEFNDGFDENLMGDEEDRARLAALTEKERETEIFKRIEQREVMKTRFVNNRKKLTDHIINHFMRISTLNWMVLFCIYKYNCLIWTHNWIFFF